MTRPRVPSEDGTATSTRAGEVLQTAGRLFLAKGYASTTMNDIARAAGVLPGSLYHHFPSKEAVALELLDALNKDMHELPLRLRHSGHLSKSPEIRIRELCLSVAELSFRHSAAVRLRAFDPPTVASDRFRTAIKFQPVSVQRLWRSAANDLRADLPDAPVDPALLRFTMQVVAATLPSSMPFDVDPAKSATIVCDLLLHGIATNCPDDAALDMSAPLQAARDAVAMWSGNETDDALKNKILDGARRQFALRGYAATTIRDVVEASGVRTGTIYRRFTSMEGLFDEIAQNYSSQLDCAVRTVLEVGPADTADTLDALSYVTAQAKRRFGYENRMMSLGWYPTEGDQPAFVSEYRQKVTKRLSIVEDILSAGQLSGAVPQEHSPEVLAPHLRNILWVRFSDYGRTSTRHEQRFLRSHLLRGVTSQ